ncbi:hypothetical protein [Plantibacter sp. MMLR14_011]|uniref:hypothetical protein n=1 Tax=Plantibacter sp. MMLR14_011 TaxID=1898746 RepID=UPI0008DD18AC|nr:hypothetical protein [Plantibacter sp. MMLR14_011]OII42293.1 hypothetical protein BIU99_15675 [Plantibacter sp. MMLR14_011]
MHRIDRPRSRPIAVGRGAVAALTLGLLLMPTSPAAAAPMVATEVTAAECVTTVPGGSRCGVLTVPLSRTVPDSAEATLPYVLVPAALETGRPPLVYLAGGSALSSLDIQRLAVEDGLAADRDVVFVERRGGLDATPSLDCAPANAAIRASLGAHGDRAARVAAVDAAFASCTASWQEDGVVPSDFGVAPAAADLRDLRQQLGYARWTILAVGTSAGVALAAPDVDPGGVDGVVLDGPDLGAPGIVSAGGVAAALAVVRARVEPQGTVPSVPAAPQAAAAEEPESATPDTAPSEPTRSAGILTAATDALVAAPHRTSGAHAITLGGDALLAIASHALSEPIAQAALPVLLSSIADGDSTVLDPVANDAIARLGDSGGILDRVLGCSTTGWPGAAERSDAEVTTTTLLEDVAAAACSSFAVGATPPPGAIGTSVFVLGAPEQAAALAGPVAGGTADALVAVFPGSGAVPSASSACARVAMRAWLSDPASYRAALCDADDAAVAVVDRADVAASPRWAQQTSSDAGGGWSLLVLPILFGLVTIGWSVAWGYRLITQALRRQPVQDGLLLGIAPVFGATWAIGGAVVLVRAATSSPAIALVGVPAALPWLSIALLVSCLGLVPVWQGAHRGSRLRIAALSLLWAATAGWTALFVLAWW